MGLTVAATGPASPRRTRAWHDGVLMRAIFFSPDDAEAVAARLRADGFEADVVVERLSGEDDDEDHPWAVVGDAPPFMVELLVDEYEGWLDAEDAVAPASPLPPLDLPAAPKQIKRPTGD